MNVRKHFYQFIKNSIKKTGYLLLSKRYINSKTKIKIQCPNGHRYSILWRSFQQGSRCKLCYHERRRLTYQFVKNAIEKTGYRLLSKKYINASSELKIQCPEGHKYSISYNGFRRGYRCNKCFHKRESLTYRFVKEAIEKTGYKLLSKKYVNNNTKIKLQCPEGHKFSTRYNSFKNGNRCPICFKKKSREIYDKAKKLSYNYVKNYIETNALGYKLLSTHYINNLAKLKIECDKGHIYYTSFSNFRCIGGGRCPICNGHHNIKFTFDFVKNYIEVNGYKLLSTSYKSTNKKLKLKCDKGHIYKVIFNNFYRNGTRCPICSPKYSKISQELFWLIHNQTKNQFKEIYFGELNHEYEIKIDKMGHFRRLDFYVNRVNKCIEFDGTFWHQDIDKDIKRDKEITRAMPDIKILHIRENDYRRSPENTLKQCIGFINN